MIILFFGCVSETKEQEVEKKSEPSKEPTKKPEPTSQPPAKVPDPSPTPQPIKTKPTAEPPPAKQDTTLKKSSINRDIKVDIIVDTDSFSPSDSELNEFFRVTNNILVDKADVEMKLMKTRRVSYSGIKNSIIISRTIVTNDILKKIYESEDPPEFFIFLRADDTSATYGGYAIGIDLAGSCNRYRDPQGDKKNRVYGGLMDWKHMYSSCGYDSSDPKNPVHISNMSIDGECRNRRGTACIFREDFGYYMCNDNESLNSFYAKDRYNFLAASTVHELMHHFGEHGNYDNFGTEKCSEIMGGTSYDDDTLNTFQKNAGICPKLFEVFKASYQEC